MMVLAGQRVIHKRYGCGVAKEPDRDNDHIVILFQNGNEVTFGYVLTFEKGFACFEDPAAQSFVEEDIKKLKETKRAKEEEKQQRLREQREQSEEEAKPLSRKKKTDFEGGFGEDYHVEHLARQPVYPYKKVEDLFKIRIAGFGRGINPTDDSIVLISSVEKKRTGFLYHDRWDANGDYLYSGEGKNGDQKLTIGNKALVNSIKEEKNIHLLVKFSSEEYIYQGVFKCIDYTLEEEEDEEGNSRKEYKFRLRKEK